MPSPSHPVPQPLQTDAGSLAEDRFRRERFESHELAIVLSHYDLSVVEQLRGYPRGSRKSPKLLIRAKRGEFLLKRRAPGQDDPYRVAFDHSLQLRLAEKGYPVAELIGTRDDNNSMLQFNGRIYEMFEYVHGTRYDKTSRAAEEVGRSLGAFHRLLKNFRSEFQPPITSFHNAGEVDTKFAQIAPAVSRADPEGDQASLARTCEFLRMAYHDAAKRVDELGFRRWPVGIVHGDWHPGNLLYRDGKVVAVLDFDSARMEPRAVDVANAALQFTIRMGDLEQPESWPEGLDDTLMRRILHGYDLTASEPLSAEERQALPWLIIEALIVESIVPIAATGSFARLSGSAFLQMIEGKVRWIRPWAVQLQQAAQET